MGKGKEEGTEEGTEKIDLNEATVEQLAEIEGFDVQRARLVVDYRDKNGIFISWDDVKNVKGISNSLREKLQAAATIGEGEESEEADEQTGEKTRGVSDDESEDVTMLVALQALAEMDLGAAAAYELAATAFDDEEVSDQLMAFRDDHIRHVDSLERLAAAMGGEPMDRTAVEDSLLVRLAEVAGALGPRPALLAMISSEQLTNGTYEAMLELPWETEVSSVLQRNFEDEQRHLSWLEENRDRFAPEPPAEAPEART